MGIIFNGNVTINGNVEMYDNRSMKITTQNEISVPISELSQFIEDNLKYSPNKQEYLDATNVLASSEDEGIIQSAFQKMRNLANELGRGIFISGLSQVVAEAIKNLLS